jgi:hypothetical protein
MLVVMALQDGKDSSNDDENASSLACTIRSLRVSNYFGRNMNVSCGDIVTDAIHTLQVRPLLLGDALVKTLNSLFERWHIKVLYFLATDLSKWMRNLSWKQQIHDLNEEVATRQI